MLLDRDSERAVLDQFVADLHMGESRALVVRGEAGIGKTELLGYLLGQVEGRQVVRTVGVEAEQEFAFAALHQVCAPLLGRLAQLPPPQQEALSIAFGLTVGRPPDPFMVGMAVLGLFAEVAHERPLLCLIDDAQWLDRESAKVLGFAARRLRAESVAMVFAVRGSDVDNAELPDLTGLPEVLVSRLPNEDARALLALAHPGPTDDRVVDRIIAESKGNPLALLELPRGFTPAELAGGFGLLASVALPHRIEESFRRQIDTLSPMTRRVLLVAAAEPVGDPVLVRRALDRLSTGVEFDLGTREEERGFLDFGSRVTFRHPLLRSAIYRAASPEERRKAHWALAQVTDPVADPDRRAWHRALSADGEDEEVAAELDHCAARAQARGGPSAAAAFFERAADLTPDSERRGQRLVAAAQARYQAGVPDAALQLLARAEATLRSPLDLAQVDVLHARIAFTMHRGPEAPVLLLKAATRLETLDLRLARDTYLEALRAAWFVAHLTSGPGLHELSSAALSVRAAAQPNNPSDLLLEGLATRYRDGYAAGAPLLKQALAELTAAEPSGTVGLQRLWFAATIALDLWDDEASDLVTTQFVEFARASGALSSLPLALTQRIVMQVFTGDLTGAGWSLEELDAVLQGTGLDDFPYAAQLRAVWLGEEERAAAMIDETTRETTRRGEGVGVVAAGWMQALLFNSLGRYDEALAAARRATEPRQDLGVVTWSALVELIIAAARTDSRDEAVEALGRLGVMTKASGTDWALGLQARGAALVSDTVAAERHYREAIERLARTRIRGELARTHLHYGEWLRRQGRRNDARESLRTAHTMLTAMGMDAFAKRAARELGATGGLVRKQADSTSSQLTVQEAQIVRLARDGLSNAEIGTRLFISPRTVEWHLGKVFAKLQITSRRQLQR